MARLPTGIPANLFVFGNASRGYHHNSSRTPSGWLDHATSTQLTICVACQNKFRRLLEPTQTLLPRLPFLLLVSKQTLMCRLEPTRKRNTCATVQTSVQVPRALCNADRERNDRYTTYGQTSALMPPTSLSHLANPATEHMGKPVHERSGDIPGDSYSITLSVGL